jgi:hypothetical protein
LDFLFRFALRSLNIQLAGQDTHVLVAAAREVDYQYVMRRHPRRNPQALGDGVRASSAGRMPSVRASFTTASSTCASSAETYSARPESCSRVLRADGGVVETGRDGVRQRDLAVFILQHVGIGALQHAGRSALEARRVIAERLAAAAGFDADQANFLSSGELVERADGIRSAADAGDDRGRQTAFFLQNLLRISMPMTRLKSRTIVGYGCGPSALPRM